MPITQRITPCLWFDNQAEPAAQFYTSIFPNSSIGRVSRYGEEGREVHGQEPGSVLTVEFQLDSQRFTALNGGPVFQFNEALSLQIDCETQAEVDDYWEKLTAGGDAKSQQCGWLKDKYGLSWQVVPSMISRLLTGPNAAGRGRMMQALFQMRKLDIAALQRAYDG